MSAFQTIYVRDGETVFEGMCEACALAEEKLYAPKQSPRIEGTLRRHVDLGFRTCPRGHRILVKRMRLMRAA